ncbi:putative prophage MuSo1, DNA transposition protein [Thermodesulfovibrio sp. N1]|nr:putative prophage MuSo1, DNA transposition protein [Thermodesulfovibrio sp. N1]
MKRIFARTTNVERFAGAMTRLMNRQEGIPGMALIFGEPGLGKTKTSLWWIANNDGIFIRTKKLMTGRWLLEEIVAELGEQPARRVSELFRQAQDQLLERPRPIFVDEADYLTHDVRVLETLRDLHDVTGVPVIFIGMDHADKKLARYKHLFDRFSEIVKFNPLTEHDIRMIADQLCDVRLSDDAIQHIATQANRFRRVMVWLYRAEAVAKANSLKEV